MEHRILTSPTRIVAGAQGTASADKRLWAFTVSGAMTGSRKPVITALNGGGVAFESTSVDFTAT
jgi:hypothetical protein